MTKEPLTDVENVIVPSRTQVKAAIRKLKASRGRPARDPEREKRLRGFGITARDATRLERALCALVDYEGPVGQALVSVGKSEWGLHWTCEALRKILDNE